MISPNAGHLFNPFCFIHGKSRSGLKGHRRNISLACHFFVPSLILSRCRIGGNGMGVTLTLWPNNQTIANGLIVSGENDGCMVPSEATKQSILSMACGKLWYGSSCVKEPSTRDPFDPYGRVAATTSDATAPTAL